MVLVVCELSRCCFGSVWDEAGKSRRKKSAVSVIFVSAGRNVYFSFESNSNHRNRCCFRVDKVREVAGHSTIKSDK